MDQPSVSLDQATRIRETPVHLEIGGRTVGVVELLSGTVIIVFGMIALFVGPLGSVTFRLGLVTFPVVLVLWLIGLFVIVLGMSSMSETSRPVVKAGFGRAGPIMRHPGGYGFEHSYKQADKEKAAAHRKETGESD